MFEISSSDWNRIQDSYNFERVEISRDAFNYSVHPENGVGRMGAGQEMDSWITDLINRIIHARWSWVMMMYFFEKGIPDDEWKISPGRKGQSIEYFPHFSEDDFYTKARFNYFEDNFYYKIYSAWDTLGHILNLMFDLNISKVDFHKAVKGLEIIRPTLCLELKGIMDSDAFQKLKSLRHDTIHNELPTGISKMVGKIPGGFSFGGGTYTPSKRIVENAKDVLDLLGDTLSAIGKQIATDAP